MLASHFEKSSFREKLLEHLFVGELLKELWIRDNAGAEVLRPEVDFGGYDLVIELDGIIRHLQLKASHAEAKAAKVNISKQLQQKPSGCVIWLRFDPTTLKLGPFLWFGSEPGTPMGDISKYPLAKNTRADSTGKKGFRKNLHCVPKSAFTRLNSIGEVIERLFGIIHEFGTVASSQSTS